MAEHTPPPWGLDGSYVVAKFGPTIADCGKSPSLDHGVRRANADFIVKAVNNHDALVAALTLAEDILSRAPFSNALWPNGMHPMTGITQIRDALALVGSPKP
jgi:hypothetical protein